MAKEHTILGDIKRAIIGENADEDAFDEDLKMYANGVFVILRQLGIGPQDGFSLVTGKETWSDFIPNQTVVGMVKPYIVTKIRLLFDPPTNSSILESMKQVVAEFEWRGNVDVETNWSNSK